MRNVDPGTEGEEGDGGTVVLVILLYLYTRVIFPEEIK
jgi:hypothetical protein